MSARVSVSFSPPYVRHGRQEFGFGYLGGLLQSELVFLRYWKVVRVSVTPV